MDVSQLARYYAMLDRACIAMLFCGMFPTTILLYFHPYPELITSAHYIGTFLLVLFMLTTAILGQFVESFSKLIYPTTIIALLGCFSLMLYDCWVCNFPEEQSSNLIFFSILTVWLIRTVKHLIIYMLFMLTCVISLFGLAADPLSDSSYFILRYLCFGILQFTLFYIILTTLNDFVRNDLKYESLFTNLNDGLIYVDQNDIIQTVNKRFTELTGYTEDDILGEKAVETFVTEAEAELVAFHQNERENGRSSSYLVPVKHKEGHDVWMLIKGIPTFHPDGTLSGSYGLHTDVTELKEAENKLKESSDLLYQLNVELERSNKDLEQFAYIASHDLKAPLRNVSTFAGLLRKKYEPQLDTTASDYLDLITDGCKRMDKLIEDLLQYSRSGKESMEFKQVNLENTLTIVQHQLSSLIEETNTTINFGKLPTIIADSSQIIRLFQNLIQNAIKYKSNEDPMVFIDFEICKTGITFSVKDNGIGIKAGEEEKIFKLFHRLSSSASESSGIGLAVCKKIVENHGGNIWVESKFGFGSTFNFTISYPE